MAWLRQLLDWQKETEDPGEFLESLRFDLSRNEVFVFTPKGDVIALPAGATPVDFAYAIHSDVGHTCVGAKVNGRIVPLKYNLRNGDVVEILTQPGHVPSKDWLAVVKTSRARNKIRHFINTTEREKAIEIGQKYLDKEARRLGVSVARISRGAMEQVAGEYGYSKIEDLHAALGYGKFSARQVLHKLAPEQVAADAPPEPPKPVQQPLPHPDGGAGAPGANTGDLVIKVKGIDDLLVYRAKCCNPIRGEAIVGYVTRGKGVAVHSVTCANVQNLMYEVERKIDVEWASQSPQFQVKMIIYTDDRPGMLNQLTSVLFNESSNIRSLEARPDDKRGGDGTVNEVVQALMADERDLTFGVVPFGSGNYLANEIGLRHPPGQADPGRAVGGWCRGRLRGLPARVRR
jgi:GTP pyrophosphokinase